VSGPLVPVSPPPRPILEDLPGSFDPIEGLRRVRHRRHPVLLLSGLAGHPGARFSILAWDPALVVAIRGGEARLIREGNGRRTVETRPARDPFDLLKALAPAGALQRAAPGLPFSGGAIGYLGFGLRRAIERLPPGPPDPLGQPDAWFGLYDRAAVYDHLERRAVLVATGLGAENERQRVERAAAALADLRGSLSRTVRAPAGPRVPGPAARRRAFSRTGRKDYLRTIERALDYIAAGDIYQVNLSHRIECPFEGDPLALFQDVAVRNPAPFAAYIDAGDFQIVSASPERLVSIVGDRARSSPIKGTRPRGGTAEQDERLARELLSSPKDRAENVMIADLVRNDLGRVCEPGSIRAEPLCALESFATVHHLVTTVSGRLRPDADRIDLVRALFPGGSMTGAPKVRAMEIIDELEGEERGIYSGAIGYLSLDGGMDLNVVIRTLVCSRGTAHVRVGGAIVADSDPEREHAETLDKARALLEALNADLASL
jgi:para-aminobenzoate synthetase component 1